MLQLEPNITPVISSLILSLSEIATSYKDCDNENLSGHSECTVANVSKPLNLNSVGIDDNGKEESGSSEKTQNHPSGVWPLICYVETTPALKFSWSKASLKRKTFQLLNVDPDNVSDKKLDLP